MRRDKPPVFITSPANMKNGTASKGKLLEPSMMFCAKICASNMFRCHISAAPHNNKEKAMGTPNNMAANNEERKTAMVMVCVFLFSAAWTGPRARLRIPECRSAPLR